MLINDVLCEMPIIYCEKANGRQEITRAFTAQPAALKPYLEKALSMFEDFDKEKLEILLRTSSMNNGIIGELEVTVKYNGDYLIFDRLFSYYDKVLPVMFVGNEKDVLRECATEDDFIKMFDKRYPMVDSDREALKAGVKAAKKTIDNSIADTDILYNYIEFLQ